MQKSLIVFIFNILAISCFAQVQDIIDRDIAIIKYVPYGRLSFQDSRKTKRINKQFRLKNHEYREVLSLDTMAIPYLIEKIGDTTLTTISIPCITRLLKRGDVAFALLNDIIPVPFASVSPSQWDSHSCGTLPDGAWDYIDQYRLRFQEELRGYFLSKRGKAWVKLLKEENNKEESAKLVKIALNNGY